MRHCIPIGRGNRLKTDKVRIRIPPVPLRLSHKLKGTNKMILVLLLGCLHTSPQQGWIEVESPPDTLYTKCFVWAYLDKKESIGGPACFTYSYSDITK